MGEIISLEKALKSFLWENLNNVYEIEEYEIVIESDTRVLVKSKLERIYPNPRPNLQSHLFKGFINEKGDIEIDLNIFTTEKPVVNEGN